VCENKKIKILTKEISYCHIYSINTSPQKLTLISYDNKILKNALCLNFFAMLDYFLGSIEIGVGS
jgi:hypothetical protein